MSNRIVRWFRRRSTHAEEQVRDPVPVAQGQRAASAAPPQSSVQDDASSTAPVRSKTGTVGGTRPYKSSRNQQTSRIIQAPRPELQYPGRPAALLSNDIGEAALQLLTAQESASPGIALWLYGTYFTNNAEEQSGRISESVAELLESHSAEQSSLVRSKAAFDLITRPQYRYARSEGDDSSRDHALHLLRSLPNDDPNDRHYRVVIDESTDVTDPELVIAALESGDYLRFEQRNCHVATCAVCIEPGDPSLRIPGHNDRNTVITRRATLKHDTDLMGRLAKFVDPRSWAAATGPATGMTTGWAHSVPVTRNGDGSLTKVDLFAGAAAVPLGHPWNGLLFEEVSNLALRSWNVLLDVDFTTALNALEVTHVFNAYLKGPARAKMIRDDGYLRVTKSNNQYVVEMRKELNFVDFGVYAHDMIEYMLPFVACAWFDDVYNQWMDTIMGVDSAADAASFETKVKDLPFNPPQPPY